MYMRLLKSAIYYIAFCLCFLLTEIQQNDILNIKLV